MRELRWLAMGLLPALAAAATGVVLFEVIGLRFPVGALIAITLMAGLPIALLHLFIVAAPLYSMAIGRWPLRWWNAALGGFLVGSGPFAILALMLFGGHVMRGEVPDIAGLGIPFLIGGIPGLTGGLVFRAIRGRDPRDVATAA